MKRDTLYRPRRVESELDFDVDGTKVYTVSFNDAVVDRAPFLDRLQMIKRENRLDLSERASFAIFHEGESADYLVLAWWDNDNELLNLVSVREGEGTWIDDPLRYSFCVWDLEIMWAERNFFIETLYCKDPDPERWRQLRFRKEP